MEAKDLDQQSKITLLRGQAFSGALTQRGTVSDIEVYKEVLSDRFSEARTVDEHERLLVLRKRVQELDIETRQLDYAQKSAEIQLKQAQQKEFIQRGQNIAAITISIGIGIYLLQSIPLAGLLFLILGLAKPLGYSLGEIGTFLNGLKSFQKGSNKIFSDEEVQYEESESARS